MKQITTRIVFLHLLILVSSIYSMDYWKPTKAAYANLYAAVAQRTRNALTTIQRSGFDQDPNTVDYLFPTVASLMFSGGLATPVTFCCDQFTITRYIFAAATALSSLHAIRLKPLYEFIQLYKQVHDGVIPETKIPIIKKQIMDLNPAIVPPRFFTALVFNIIMRRENHLLHDFETFKKLIEHSNDIDEGHNKHILLTMCCGVIENPHTLHEITKHLLKRKASPLFHHPKINDACIRLIHRTFDVSKTFKLILDHEPALLQQLDHYLTLAAAHNKLSEIILLLHKGADINNGKVSTRLNNNDTKVTPLHIASHNASSEIIRYLLYSGADKTITTTGENPQTALELYMGDRVAGDREIFDMLQSNKRPHISQKARTIELELHTDRKTNMAQFLTQREMGIKKLKKNIRM